MTLTEEVTQHMADSDCCKAETNIHRKQLFSGPEKNLQKGKEGAAGMGEDGNKKCFNNWLLWPPFLLHFLGQGPLPPPPRPLLPILTGCSIPESSSFKTDGFINSPGVLKITAAES